MRAIPVKKDTDEICCVSNSPKWLEPPPQRACGSNLGGCFGEKQRSNVGCNA